MIGLLSDVFCQRLELLDFVEDGPEIGIPGASLRFANDLPILGFESIQFIRRRNSLLCHPLAHLYDWIELFFPLQPVLRLVPLVTSRGGVAERLRHLDDVDDGGDVLGSNDVGGMKVCLTKSQVIPSAD